MILVFKELKFSNIATLLQMLLKLTRLTYSVGKWVLNYFDKNQWNQEWDNHSNY